MITTAPVEKPKMELSCREAHLILRLIPLRKDVSEMRQEEIAAIAHYIGCKNCRDQGLAGILDTKLSCKEAILVWAESASALWLACSPILGPRMQALIELYATEHVWGKYQWKNFAGGASWDTLSACRNYVCQQLHSYWDRIPMSPSLGDGPSGPMHLFPFLFDIFWKEKWSLDELFAVQKKRVTALLKDIESGKVTVSSGHYHSIDELVTEVQKHIAALQKFALRAT